MLISQGYRIETGELGMTLPGPDGQPKQVTKDVVVMVVNLGAGGELSIAFPKDHADNIAEGFRVASTGIVRASAADMPIIPAGGIPQAG